MNFDQSGKSTTKSHPLLQTMDPMKNLESTGWTVASSISGTARTTLYDTTRCHCQVGHVRRSPHVLREPNAAERLLPVRLSTVGGYITVEDLIRHLHEHPESLSTETCFIKRYGGDSAAHFRNKEQIQTIEMRLDELALDTMDFPTMKDSTFVNPEILTP